MNQPRLDHTYGSSLSECSAIWHCLFASDTNSNHVVSDHVLLG